MVSGKEGRGFNGIYVSLSSEEESDEKTKDGGGGSLMSVVVVNESHWV